MTPLELELKPGSYKVRVRREGYLDWNGQVDLRAGDESALSALLPEKKRQLPPGLLLRPGTGSETGTGSEAGTGSTSETGTGSGTASDLV